VKSESEIAEILPACLDRLSAKPHIAHVDMPSPDREIEKFQGCLSLSFTFITPDIISYICRILSA